MILPSLIGDRLPGRRILLAHVLQFQLEETVLWVDWEVALVDGLHLPKFENTFFELFLDDIHSFEHCITQASWIYSGVGAGTLPRGVGRGGVLRCTSPEELPQEQGASTEVGL